MSTLLADLRLALRALVRAPGFSAVAIICLALGIGANVTVFSSVYALLIRPMPFPDPERVVVLWTTEPARGVTENSFSWLDYVDATTASRAFSATGVADERRVNLGGIDEPERLSSAAVTASLFPMLGIRPALGRNIAPDEEHDGRVVVLGDGVWRRRFGADSNVVGTVVQIDGEPHTVVGVMGPNVRFPENAEVFLPLGLDEAKDMRDWRGLQVFGRLAPGVSVEEASRRLGRAMEELAARYPDSNRGLSGRVAPYREMFMDEVRPVMLVMLGAVAFVLLIACANVANLLLVRGTARAREVAVRTALGASRWHIVRFLLVESVLLAVVGSAIGLLLGAWGLELIVRALPGDLPFWMVFDINRWVVLFTAGLAAATVLLAGLVPSLSAASPAVTETLKDGGRGSSAGARGGRLRAALVTGEIALSVVLLVGATLMVRSFIRLRVGDPGFSMREAVVFNLSLSGPRFENDTAAQEFYDRIDGRLARLPGVESVARVSQLPMGNCCSQAPVLPEDRPMEVREAPFALYTVVSPGFFSTVGVRLLAGRDFAGSDRGGARVAIIDEALASVLWPGVAPARLLGRTVRHGALDDTTAKPRTIVGVAANVKQRRLTEAWRPHIYIPHAQALAYRSMEYAVRTRVPPATLVRPVRAAVRELDADLPLANLQTFEDQMAFRTFEPRIYGAMFGVFGLIALFLASIGLYGVMAFSVTQRTHEIGVRVALGALPRDVLRLVVGQGARLAAIGLLLGVPAAFALARLLRGALYGVTPNDGATFAAVVLTLASVALLASWIPARRASRVDPAQALRND
jgi:predicted permease